MFAAVFTRTYPEKDAAASLARASADGYRGVQFNLSSAGLASLPAELPEGLAEEVGRIAGAQGLAIAALSGTYNMAHPDPGVRAAARPGFANVVEAARRMGAPAVTLCTGSRNAGDMWHAHPDNESAEAWRDFRAELDFALDLAEAAGIHLGIEPEPGNVVRDATVARRLLDEVRSPRLGIVLDAANLLSPQTLADQDRVMRDAVALLGDALLLAHGKDIDPSGRVVPAGDGAVELPAFVETLRSAGFDGALIGHGFDAADAPRVATYLSRLARAAS